MNAAAQDRLVRQVARAFRVPVRMLGLTPRVALKPAHRAKGRRR